MAHSRVGGSVIHRVMACPGSVKAAAVAPPQPGESKYAQEGTMLHEVAATVLDAWKEGNSMRGDAVKAIAGLDREQRDLVAGYTRVVRDEHQLLEMDGEEATLLIEQRFSIPGLHGDFYGTADAVIYTSKALRVIDLKCGRGVSVEVEKDGKINPQLGYYTLGVLHSLGWWVTADELIPPTGHEELTDIEFLVVQPRRGGTKRRKVKISELLDLAAGMVAAVREADGPNPRREAGDHCRFCPARAVCPTTRELALKSAQEDFADPEDLATEQLAEALKAAILTEAWAKSVRQVAADRARAGIRIPGFATKLRAAKRVWTDEKVAKTVLWKLNMPFETAKTITPAEVERWAVKNGRDIDFLEQITARGPATVALVPENGSDTGTADDFPDDVPTDY
jgi:hypothetical protein